MTMTGVSQLFIDTNVLYYATNGLSPFHQIASSTLLAIRQQGVEMVISPQILREFLAVATRSYVTAGVPTLADTIQNFNTFQTTFRVVVDTEQILSNLINLVQNIRMGGKQIHDANIVATMQAYGITHLLTHNTADFARFAHLITVVPLQPGTP